MPDAAQSFRLKRVYDPPAQEDGARVLVDRLWPRGLRKEAAALDRWLKDLSPSDALRRRVHGDPEAWDDFVAAYAVELEAPAAQAAVAELRALAAQGPVTLLYAAKRDDRNNAVALRDWLARG